MQYWLIKSEPRELSIDDLAETPLRTTHWDGVRNYQARNMMRDEMKKGDLAFFYHSNCAQPGIVGIIKVTRERYPDFTAFDPNDPRYDANSDPDHSRWYMLDVKLVRKLDRTIGLGELNTHIELSGLPLLRRGNRLSVMPVSRAQWDFILALQ
ncbi:MAG: EVE domain-containing protein [Gammaproteobacteria bacterium]|nr:EVE domain-containing protein [Gammaproteobacteria bacterium]NIR98431.1 EVE domain-containing protein [Gammaproteobacteria bacterium]NIT64178.1 EVE domain-containing protein [Gammaproteobacteria bacterium]NIV21118.1 EVE domain-containing protein [Gammaproteobacteria bacterium]NIX10595.1 EVE domain-containing protein [Gammaproteobacteria bacterium]